MDIILLNIFTLLNIGRVMSQTYEHASNLRSTLLSGYQKDIRPVNNQSNAVQVNISVALFGVPEMDGVKGVVRIIAATQALWMDERISWNPSDYGGISKIQILMNEVWTPSISLATTAEFGFMSSSQFHVTFFSNGLAFFFPGAVLESRCRFNMKFWPFDKQVCDVGFYPLDYGTDQVIFSIPPNGVNTMVYTPNSEWTLDDISSYTGEMNGFSLAYFRLKLTRQSLFYVLTIILPINGIVGLTSLVFILPSESGERVSYAATIMLSLAVFLTVVSAELPKTSEPVSLMCCYILAGIVVSIISVVAAILNLTLYHRNEDVRKRLWYISLVRLSRCKQSNREQAKTEQPDEMTDSKNGKTNNKNSVSVNMSESELENEDVITWQDVSRAIDKLLIYTIVILAYIPSVCFLIYIGTATDHQI